MSKRLEIALLEGIEEVTLPGVEPHLPDHAHADGDPNPESKPGQPTPKS
jgi:hypothetical protein